MRDVRPRRPLALALAGGALAGLTALLARPHEPGWQRVTDAQGLIVAEPRACPDGLSWLVFSGEGYRYRRGDGTLVETPPCEPAAVSPDGVWRVHAAFTEGSWDLWLRNERTAEERRITRDPGNEVEPAFLPGGDAIVFASDRRRGLGATTLFVVPLARP